MLKIVISIAIGMIIGFIAIYFFGDKILKIQKK